MKDNLEKYYPKEQWVYKTTLNQLQLYSYSEKQNSIKFVGVQYIFQANKEFFKLKIIEKLYLMPIYD